MTSSIQQGKLETTISRRGFVAGSAGLTFAFTLTGGMVGRLTEALAADSAKLNAWVTIGADDTITILSPVAEMGQGMLTTLPLILAEELDADWSKVKTEFAPPIPKIYGNPHPIMRGGMATVASVSVPGYYMPLRMAGAQARRVLLDNAAKHWNVPVEELTTEPSVVVHAKSGRRISYGEIAKFATVPDEPPQITAADLKKRAAVPPDRPQGHRARRRPGEGQRQAPGTASTCRCRAWSMPPSCSRPWKAPSRRPSTPRR